MTFLATTNPCEFVAVSAGVGDFVVAAATAGKLAPEQAFVTNGKTYAYFAQSPDGTQWEYSGGGAYVVGTHTLARTGILGTSNDDKNRVNFSAPPIVDMFPSTDSLEPATQSQTQATTAHDTAVATSEAYTDAAIATVLALVLPTGTLALFQQAAAPTGWTTQTTHNDKALRVVSSSPSSGGTYAFSALMNNLNSTSPHTLSLAEIPPHAHNVGRGASTGGGVGAAGTPTVIGSFATDTQGGGAGHAHTLAMDIQYVDLIICQKN